ncbi:MAG TPA: ATP-binding protein [Vicinamibacterales bacterium]
MPHPRATRRPISSSLIASIDTYSGRLLPTDSIASEAYRFIVEAMSEGAVILSAGGAIAYSNRSFSLMIGLPVEAITGSDMRRFVAAEDLGRFNDLMFEGRQHTAHGDVRLAVEAAASLPVQLSISAFDSAFVALVQDVSQRRQDEAERLTLIRRLVDVEESERRRVARELHDQFGQQLSALTLKLATLRRDRGRRTQFSEELAPLERIATQLGADLDLLVSRLRPPALDDLGLLAALDQYIRRWAEEAGVHAELHAKGLEAGGLNSDTETALYRIVQEALNNVVKHSQAKNVALLLDQSADRVSLIIEDDGVGFNVEQHFPSHRFGVAGMRERTVLLAGTFDIESNPGHGTTVAVRIPLPHGEASDS